MYRTSVPILLTSLLAFTPLHAAVIGTSKPAESITAARIERLPAKDRAAWTAYFDRSQKQMRIDRATLAAERTPGAPEPPLPKESFSARSMALHRDAAWYGTQEARHIADVIVSFQTSAGGWSKNLDMSGPARLRGQSYTTDNLSKHLGPDDFDAPKDPHWNYVGTLDNDATNTELHFLALVSAATPGKRGEPYRTSFLKGIRYLLAAQFPNGGWPQVWPLEGGYHDAITYNDNAVTESAQVLTAVAEGGSGYAFVSADLRHKAGIAANHALDCILATQIIVNGTRTIWAQQHDALTLAPVSARNFEPVALATGESSDILLYLMELPHPSPAVIASVQSGIAWLKTVAIHDQAWIGGRNTPGGRHLEPQVRANPIWARYYSITTGKPIFGDRDKTIHDAVSDLSLERRNGYAWYGSGPQQAIDAYAIWSAHLSVAAH
ncbi:MULTISPECIES: pectate lyase [Acidobacteriaceae]|uniref:pectate lyase n=1 Tax=Acidobacteriaceae TaxID=204434 RepID=UPI00131C95FE|nr:MULTISPECIES: pectate lyase [Acidobacteriaceae]MDW5267342.1 pectate lyase [Edaphobacter sp.]